MGDITSSGGGSFFGSKVDLQDQDFGSGMVSFGGFKLSATDAAEFVMMHRTQVMQKLGMDRMEMASQHLAQIREARSIARELSDSKVWGKAHGGRHHRCPISERAVRFLKDKVGSDPKVDACQVLTIDDDNGSQLPEAVKSDYRRVVEGHAAHDVLWPYHLDALQAWESIHNETLFNHDGKWTAGKRDIGPVIVCLEDNVDNNKENVDNYIDQLNDDNNLFMTKFKAVVNKMNEALEGANSLSDKEHEALKNLLSRW